MFKEGMGGRGDRNCLLKFEKPLKLPYRSVQSSKGSCRGDPGDQAGSCITSFKHELM